MKITIDLGLIDEEGMDEALMERVIQEIVDNSSDTIKKIMQNEADNRFIEKIDTFLEEMLLNFVDRNIVITDRYGDEVERYENAREMLKGRFDNYITQEVDKKEGKPVKRVGWRGCHVDSEPRIENILKKLIPSTRKIEADVIQAVQKEVKQIIRNAKQEAVTQTVQSIVNQIDIKTT